MSNIRVAVRVRPLSEREKEKGSHEIIEVNRNTVTIENVKVLGIPEFGDSRSKYKEFSYDYCYDCLSKGQPYATQQQVFQDLGTQVLTAALDGFNACVFAYGQTGTGKTHTMMGYPGDVGLIPRICEGLFQSISECTDENVTCRVDVSYFEIYNEKVRDLLQPYLPKQSEKPSLRVREHPKEGPYVKDLSWHRVREYSDVHDLLDKGNSQRVTADTYIHDRSSRSHAIVTVSFTQARLEENRPSEIVSKIHLVDLAGSEKADPSSRPDFRKRLTEGSSINRSLVALGYVIKALAEKSLLSWSTDDMGSTQSFQGSAGGETSASNSPAGPNKQRLPFIPYRDSPLTYLLKDSLGGNSKTIMIATITPASQFYSETLSTLRYAQRAKNIINKPRVNEDSNVALIRELKKEIEKLREMLANAQKGGDFVSLQDSEDTIIAEKLLENEEMAKQLTQSWMGKWSSTHDIMKETDLSIRNLRDRNNSMGVMIDSQLPYLVGMDDDVLSTGIVIFHLKEGETTVGREDADTAQDIVLMGPNIEREHCVIHHGNGEVMVHPLQGAMCSIQGLECIEPTRLAQGDYVAFGGDQVFRFNNPAEAAKLRENRRSQGSLNTLNTSHMSFGGLSRASSYSSLGADDSNFLSPNSQLGRSYPNTRRHSDIVIHELQRKHHNEHDRIAEARRNLEHLHEEHERAEELRLEKEEEMYALHEQHRQEIEEQKQQLARLVEENERARQKAEEELQLSRESLAKEKEAFQKELDEQQKKLREVQKSELTVESSAIQTELLSVKTSSTDALGVTGVSMGTDSSDILEKGEVPAKKARRTSVDDQLRELEQNEFSRRMSYRETEESLSIQQEDIEDQYFQTQERINEKMKKIQQIEDEYKEMDKEHLNQVSEQTAVVDDLHKQEVQLEVYIQENEELMNVSRDVPRPLRSACSEMFLVDPSLQIPEYPQKTSSLHDVHAAPDNRDNMSTPQINVLSASADSVISESVTLATDSTEQKAEGKLKKEKTSAKGITTVAKDVTSRLYKAPEPKFKYVPKVKEKEVKPVSRPARVRDVDAKARSSPSRFVLEHSPSPQRSQHSPSPLRQTSKRTSPSPARDKDPKRGPSPQPTKPPLKKGTTKAGENKTKEKDSKVMSVRKKPAAAEKDSSETRAVSPSSNSDGSVSPDRLSLSPGSGGNRLPAAKLRHIASASSLASVPESVSEESEESIHKQNEPVSYVVKRRAKKGRSSQFDDEFRTHSAPDSQNMEKALDEYTLQMISSLSPDKQDSERVVPVYNTSFSVDDSDLSRKVDSESKRGDTETGDYLENEDQIKEIFETVVKKPYPDMATDEPSVVLGKRDHADTLAVSQISLPVSPRKRSKSEGAEDSEDCYDDLNENRKVCDQMDTEVAQKDSSFSEDSLNTSDVSADSLEGDGKRLTRSLPAYLIQNEKPVSDDSLNDSLEEKKDTAKEEIMEVEHLESKNEPMDTSDDTKSETVNVELKGSMNEVNSLDKKVKSTGVLTKSDIERYDVCIFDASNLSKPNLSRVALPQIDICNGAATNAETMTEQGINCQDSQMQTMDTDSPNDTSETRLKYVTAQNLTKVNLPNVSFISNAGEYSEEDNKEKTVEKEEMTVDLIDSNETVEKVKQYVEEIVDSAKEKLVEEIRNEPESAIEFCDVPSSGSLQRSDKVDTDAINEGMPVGDSVVKIETDLWKGDSEESVVENSVTEPVTTKSAESVQTQLNRSDEANPETASVIEKDENFIGSENKEDETVIGTLESNALDSENNISKSNDINDQVTTSYDNTEEDVSAVKDHEQHHNADSNLTPKHNSETEQMQLDLVGDSVLEKNETFIGSENKEYEKIIGTLESTAQDSEDNISDSNVINDQVSPNRKPEEDIYAVKDHGQHHNAVSNLPPKNNSETEQMQLDLEQSKKDQIKETKAQAEQTLSGDDYGSAAEVDSSDIEVTGLPLTRSVGVGTSLECLTAEDIDTALQGSEDSLIDPEKELQVLQDALEQLPARQSGSGPQLSTARRAARQRAMIRQQQRAGDSDGVEPCSDESPASGNLSKSSSRPGSGSRRRRRPQAKLNDKSKQRTDHTSDDYDSSENDSVYSEESLDDKVFASRATGCQNGKDFVNGSQNFVIPDSLENSDTDEMSRLFKKHRGRPSSRSKQKHESTDIEEGPDGKRTIGIQTHGRYNARPDLSDFDGSFVSGDLNRNMTISPVSLWTTDRSETGKKSARNSSSSSVVGTSNDPEKSITPRSTPRSSTKSVSSVFLENSNLDRGVTEVWSTSASDLRPLQRFDDDLSYIMETESMIPGVPPLDFSDYVQNSGSFAASSGEVSRPECSTPKNSGRTVSITYPESQVERVSNLDCTVPVTFEVTVHEENTNILYNVEKTEYKTYALQNGDQGRVQVIPDTIHVNMTEKLSSQAEEKFVSQTSENVKFEMPHQEDNSESGILETEKAIRSTYSSERETVTENDQIKSDETKEMKEYIEDCTQYKVPSDTNFEEQKKGKKAKLQHSGLVEATNYPGNKCDAPQNDLKVLGELSNMDESDYTSDYGTFISIDGRRCSDSGEDSISPGISPRTANISKQNDPMGKNALTYKEAIAPLETSLENTDLLYSSISPQQSQQICSTEDVITPLVIAARTEQSSPVQFILSTVLEASSVSQTSDEGVQGENNVNQNFNNPEIVTVTTSINTSPNEADDTDSGSCSTVRPQTQANEHLTCLSQETLNDLDTEIAEPADVEKEKMNSIPVENLNSPRYDKSCSSADEFISLEQTESNSSTCSSEYRTPQQSPRDIENSETSDQVANVVIPDIDDNISTTPRVEEGISAIQGPVLTSSPKVPPSVRTVSVNTEMTATANTISPQSARVREVFGGPHDPIHTEATRREIEAKIARLQHNVRSLSDSAISSDYTDCDSSSPRGNRVYDSERKPICKTFGKPSVKSSDDSADGNIDPRRTLNFESEGVKKSPFKDSGSILDEEKNGTSDEEIKNERGDSGEVTNIKDTEDMLSSFKRGKGRCHFLPIVGSIGKFPETVVGAVLAIKPYPLQRSASLDSIATLVNTGTSLSRAARQSQSIEDMHAMPDHNDKEITTENKIAVSSNDFGEVDENENLLSSGGLDAQYGDRPLSPGEIGIGQGSIDDMIAAVENGNIRPDTDLPVAAANAKIVTEKSTSMSFLDERHTPEYHRSLSEGNIDDLDDTNDMSCTSNDSITFVFVGKEYAQSNGENEEEYIEYTNEVTEAPEKTFSNKENVRKQINISGRGPSLDASSTDSDDSVLLSRSASGESVLIEDNTEDQVSTHSASEEIEDIIQSMNQTTKLHSQRDIKDESPLTYTDISDGPLSNRKAGMDDDDDSAPLRHRFGIDESVLPIAERSVSADNIPKQVTLLKDMNRSRSTSMLDMAAAENEESESGIFPPALSYVDEDQTDQSISLRTMSEGALEQISQRSTSDRGVTFSDETSSELQSSEMEESSSACIQSVCSNTSSIEELVEEYSINYTSNNPKFRNQVLEDDEEMHFLEEEEHIREVLREVGKFFLPKPSQHDKGTSTDPEDITVTDVPDDHSPTSNSGTQTAGNMPTVLQPNQIILPALAAPFRAQSVDSFGLGRHGQDIELSEGAENWCTLGELMVETTHLLRTVNEKLPNLERRESVSSADSQAILRQWQEISVQTGSSLGDLHTVGLQTDETLFHDSLPARKAINETSRGTQVDSKFKMNHLQISEMCTEDLMILPLPIIETSVQYDDATSGLPEIEESCTASQQTSQFTAAPKQDEDSQSTGEKLKTSENTNDGESYLSTLPVSNLHAHKSFTPLTSKSSVQTARFIPQVKAELGLDEDDEDQMSTGRKNTEYKSPEISPRSQKSALTLPNTPEMEELRKEHNKLMENIRKASDNRKSRKDAIKSRKQIPSELNLSEDKSFTEESLDNSIDREMQKEVPDETVSDDQYRPDTRSSVSSSLTSPQEFVKIDIQMDPNAGVTIENIVFKERKRKEPKNEHPDETHTHSWQLFRDDVEKPAGESRHRAGSGSSISSSDTCVSSEVAKVMASPANDSKDYTDEREGALNPVYLNEDTEPDDADEAESFVSNSESVVEDDIVPQDYSKKETVPSSGNIREKGNKGIAENDDPRERGHVRHPTFLKSETSPKLKSERQHPDMSPSPELFETGSTAKECIPPVDKFEQDKLSKEPNLLREDLLPEKTAAKYVIPNEDIIIPETHKRDSAVLPLFNGSSKPKDSLHEESTSEDDSVIEDIVEPINHNRNQSLPPRLTDKADSSKDIQTEPEHSDDATQASVEISDDCTQTDPDTSIESVTNSIVVSPNSTNPVKDGKSPTEKYTGEEPKSPENLKNELEKLHNQRQHMIEMLGLSHMPPSLTVELLEAKLNYCIGQTDLLLDSLEDNVRQDSQKQSHESAENQKAIDYIEKYRADLKKSKEDIDECRERLNKRNEMGLGRGRTPYRKSDLQRRTQIDAFKLERMREQQDYDRSRKNPASKGNTPHQGNTPLRGNTPMMGNSPVVTPRSERSRSSSPTYSPGYMTPREHKAHLVDLRRQLISDVMEEETRHRSESPALYSPPPTRNTRPRDGSLGFSPKTSVSTTDVPERSSPTYNTFVVPPRRSPTSPQRLPFNRYRGPTEPRYPDTFDTRMVAESIYSPQESAAILQEIEEYKKKMPGISTPMEEMLRRSSFSSTGSQRSDSSRKDPFLSPRSQSDSRSSRKSSSPVARQPDYSQPLSLNLDGLNDDETQPYSPYSAYAREHVLPRERSPVGTGGVVRGTYELYHSQSNSESDSSSVLSFGSDLDTNQRPRLNSLDEDAVKRLRPVCADDIKARLGRHKR